MSTPEKPATPAKKVAKKAAKKVAKKAAADDGRRIPVSRVNKELQDFKRQYAKDLEERKAFEEKATGVLDATVKELFQRPEETPGEMQHIAVRQFQRSGGKGVLADAAVKVLTRELGGTEDETRKFLSAIETVI